MFDFGRQWDRGQLQGLVCNPYLGKEVEPRAWLDHSGIFRGDDSKSLLSLLIVDHLMQVLGFHERKRHVVTLRLFNTTNDRSVG